MNLFYFAETGSVAFRYVSQENNEYVLFYCNILSLFIIQYVSSTSTAVCAVCVQAQLVQYSGILQLFHVRVFKGN